MCQPLIPPWCERTKPAVGCRFGFDRFAWGVGGCGGLGLVKIKLGFCFGLGVGRIGRKPREERRLLNLNGEWEGGIFFVIVQHEIIVIFHCRKINIKIFS